MKLKDTHIRIWITKTLHMKIKKMAQHDQRSFKRTLEILVNEALALREYRAENFKTDESSSKELI